MFVPSCSTEVRFKPHLGHEIGMLRILAAQRGQRLPAYNIKAHTIRVTQLVRNSALKYPEP